MVRLPVPTGHPVALIIDISRSMEETDIAPSRIDAAKTAAIEFARRLPRQSRLALVTFGNFAAVVVPLTSDRTRVAEAIASLTTQLRTQLGTGLMEGVEALGGEGSPPAQAPGFRAVAVLLSDGRASDGVPPQEAARAARARGIRVHTVGLGTAADPSTLRSGYFGVLDEATLRMIADETGGAILQGGRGRSPARDLPRARGADRLGAPAHGRLRRPGRGRCDPARRRRRAADDVCSARLSGVESWPPATAAGRHRRGETMVAGDYGAGWGVSGRRSSVGLPITMWT